MSKVSFTSHHEDPAQPCDRSGRSRVCPLSGSPRTTPDRSAGHSGRSSPATPRGGAQVPRVQCAFRRCRPVDQNELGRTLPKPAHTERSRSPSVGQRPHAGRSTLRLLAKPSRDLESGGLDRGPIHETTPQWTLTPPNPATRALQPRPAESGGAATHRLAGGVGHRLRGPGGSGVPDSRIGYRRFVVPPSIELGHLERACWKIQPSTSRRDPTEQTERRLGSCLSEPITDHAPRLRYREPGLTRDQPRGRDPPRLASLPEVLLLS
jgi:hypothetical protein